ncbi:MAG: AAA family ATPase [Chloroflexi bacterium]|nr:AAA family ATPase [Chloroflexota bacterium]
MILSGYHILERLYESTTSQVYRARRASDNRPVILKALKQIHPPPEKIAWFKREYDTTRTLDCADVVDVYSLENNQGRWVMRLEDFGGESLERLNLAGTLALSEFLRLAIALTEILGQIHQRHVIHKDINPTNIVLNPITRQLKLIDFGISTTLPRENPTFRNPSRLEGTLAYMSPEQTGRVNRAMDYRTDFYSLGVTFYELLTGQLPFLATDPLALIHAHIATHPRSPHSLKPETPQILSEVVLKLMAKNAEDRYQSTSGLKADLEECLRQSQREASRWQAAQRIEPFPLGQQDISDRFQIPQKLYGREREIKILLAAFERASGRMNAAREGGGMKEQLHPSSPAPVGFRLHPSEMLLVSGAAGIGKTALVREVYPPLTRQGGYFIAGKFDQFQRNIPYAALIQAFRALIRQLLTESETAIAAWRGTGYTRPRREPESIQPDLSKFYPGIYSASPSVSHLFG